MALTGGMMAAPTRLAMKLPAAAVSTEYLAALKVLSDETMSKACELLLSDRDYEGDIASATTADDEQERSTDLEQLQELYRVCCKSAQVIHAEAVAVAAAPVPTAPPTAFTPAARGGGTGGPAAVATKNMIPNRRMVARAPNNINLGAKRVMLEREKSDSSMSPSAAAAAAASSSHAPPPAKKSRAPRPDSTLAAPPPSAMQFLAKLNNDSGAKAIVPDAPKQQPAASSLAVAKATKKAAQASSSNNSSPSSKLKQPVTATAKPPPPSLSVATRTQPHRGSRK